MDPRHLSVGLGVFLLLSAFCGAARELENDVLEMVSANKPQHLEKVGEARYFGSDEFLGDEASDYVTPHNNARTAVRANIPNLRWDTTLADYARKWANTRASAGCNLVHSGGQYGENIYWSSWQSVPGDAVASWVSEKAYYDYNSNTCAANKICGHYTQVVWRNTVRVGCGSARCSNGGKFVVCSYDPPGNWNGEWPY
ncbi:hypothetical protein R1flu_013337 [Riccia fluitans]|uniref:SCP domain-containing protein n=1 Tax=Riccia fluitans TaxID=41844 RepID=A0ABD1YD31_9MARC